MKFKKYTKEQFILAVMSSRSIAQALEKLNIKPCGGNYQTVKKYIRILELDTSHMKGQGWSSGKELVSKRPLSDYLSNRYPIGSNRLRKRLIRDSVFDKRCCGCKKTHWKCFIKNKLKPIPLELDHIDGNNQNNTLSNLRLLCPNCHAMTPTYRGKNKKKV